MAKIAKLRYDGAMRASFGIIGCLCYFTLASCAPTVAPPPLPENFVHLREVAPTIVQDMRYFGSMNFVGRPVAGYGAPECVLALPAAEALAQVQRDIETEGLTLKVFDCYRPQRAVDDFVVWSEDPEQATKAEYYPNLEKTTLFPEGYIAERSGHSRGATVDLALASVDESASSSAGPSIPCTDATGDKTPAGQLDFGTAFDCFDITSNTANPRIVGEAAANRMKLVEVMKARGFVNYPLEWWHFTYQPEPHPDTYFDFEIR